MRKCFSVLVAFIVLAMITFTTSLPVNAARSGGVDIPDASGVEWNNGSASYGGALFVNTAKTSSVVASSIKNNTATNYGGGIYLNGTANLTNTNVSSNSAAYGGGIMSFGSLNVKGGEISQNTSTSSGGGIYSSLNAEILGTTFASNSAANGGAILNSGIMTAGGAFSKNTATSWGGAIYNTGDLTIADNTTFTENKAGSVGGAITNALGTSVLTVGSNVSFIDNESVNDGGAIGNYKGAALVKGTTFTGNKAQTGTSDSDAIGGGAMSLGAESQTQIANAKFTSNTSGFNGGAIGTRHALSASNVDAKLDIKNSTFTGNKATGTVTSTFSRGSATGGNGGAIDNHFYNSENKNGYVYVADSIFTSNEAIKGGAIYNDGTADAASNIAKMYINNATFESNTASVSGGAIYNTGEMIIENSIFGNASLGNTSTSDGGAIYNKGVLTINNSFFSNNHSDAWGGVIENGTDSSLTINGGFFTENSADEYAGALDIYKSTATIDGAKFIQNTAGIGGGAIFANKSVKIKNAEFTKNSALEEGGAIASSAALEIVKTIFDGNTSNDGGGAIYNYHTAGYVDIKDSIIKNSESSSGGGLFLLSKTDVSNINNVEFFNNKALEDVTADGSGGGAILVGSDARVNISNSTSFTSNSSATRGGAVTTRTTNENNANLGLTISDTIFTSNTAATDGGAIYANAWHDATGEDGAKIISSKFISNEANNGGAIYNDAVAEKIGNLIITDSQFTNNKTTNVGGAIYNSGIMTAGGTFNNNTAASRGGAIFNYGNLSVNNTTFTGNKTTSNSYPSQGGAIYNAGDYDYQDKYGILTISDSVFGSANDSTQGNIAMQGGAISNDSNNGYYAQLTLNNTSFYYNKAQSSADSGYSALGGAIHNLSNSDIDVSGNTIFKGNSAEGFSAEGGAIYNANWEKLTFKDSVTFDSNTVKDTFGKNGGLGGAISHHSGDLIFKEEALFTGNKAISIGSAKEQPSGGAIYNDGTITFEKGATFTGNESMYGGAIFNFETITINDGTFIGNIAGDEGGAIFNILGEVNINAVNSNVVFSGNTANGVANDITNYYGDVILDAAAGKTITLEGGINGISGTLNITGAGTVDIKGTLNNQTVAVTAGELHLAEGSSVDNSTITVSSGATFNTIDNEINDYKTVTNLLTGANVQADVKLTAGEIDKYTGAGTITLTGLNVLEDKDGSATISMATGVTNVAVIENLAAYTSANRYTVTGSTDSSGNITVTKDTEKTGGLTNAVADTTSAVAEKVSYNTTTNTEYGTAGASTSNRTIEKADLTVNANNTDITAAENAEGIIVGDGTNPSSLTVNNANMKDFKTGTDGAVKVAANSTLNLNNTTIDKTNTSGGVNNEGTANFNEGTNVAKVVNTGTANVGAGANVDDFTNDGTVNIEVTEDFSTTISDMSGLGTNGTTNVNVGAGSNVAWTTTGIIQKTLTITGPGHIGIYGGDIVAKVVSEVTGHTLVINNAIIGALDNIAVGAHTELATGSSVSGKITNDQLLDITASLYNISAAGIVDTAGTGASGTLNIGNGTNDANVVALTGTPIAQQDLNILSKGSLTANLSDITIGSGTIDNEGVLTLTESTDLTPLSYTITGSGTTAIKADEGITITLNTTTNPIDNIVDLQSGILKATSTSGAQNFTGIVANGGTLNVQDTKLAAISLGNLDLTNNDLKILIDADITGATSDILSAASVTGVNKISITDINLTTSGSNSVQIADTSVSSYVDLSNTTVSGAGSNMLFSYADTTGILTADTTINTVTGAIESATVDNKLFAMTGADAFDQNRDVVLAGSSISITAGTNTITGDGHDIIIANSDQTLSLKGDGVTTTLTGFDTAVNNTAGGTVNLTNVVLTGNTTDVNNNGVLNLAGGNTFDTINNAGTANITDGTSIIDNLTNSGNVQGSGTLALTGASTNTGSISTDVTNAGGSVLTNSGNISGAVANDGTLTVSGGTLSGAVTGAGTTNIIGNAIITNTVNQGTYSVATGASLTTTAAALNGSSALTLTDGASLNVADGTYTPISNAIVLASGTANLTIDVNPTTGATSSFTNTAGIAGQVALNKVNLSTSMPVNAYNGTTIDLTSTTGLSAAQIADSTIQGTILTPIRYLQGSVSGGQLTYAPTGDRNDYNSFNPSVLSGVVASQIGGFLNQLNSYDEAFYNMDMYMLMTSEQRQALKFKNKYASNEGNVVYDSTISRQERAEAWFRPYATFENVRLKNGPRVSNVGYGSFFGGDSKLYDLGHGWDGMWGAYIGYNGSHQTYNGVSVYQNGGTLGASGVAYKGNFFTGLTVNVGANSGEAHNMYGHEHFSMLMAGVASKTGYNWELAKGRFIIQPSWLMSYSFVNTFDYNNAADVRISSDPLHAIQLQPELKLIGNLKHGWQPYASIAMIWNIMDKSDFKANDVALPEMSVKPYIKYGVGLRKVWGERFTGFFQTYFTNGGRNGVGLQAGFSWSVGKTK